MEKIVTFAPENTTEVWSPLCTGVLAASKEISSDISPIEPSLSSSAYVHNEDAPRPSTPSKHNPYSSTPYILSASSPNLLIDKPNQAVLQMYRDSPKSKYATTNAKLQEHLRQLQAQLTASDQRSENLEKENANLKSQLKLLEDHLAMKESTFNNRIEEAVRIEDENAELQSAVKEAGSKLNSVMSKLSEMESEATELNKEIDTKVDKIESLNNELRSFQAKNSELTAMLQNLSNEDERISAENKEFQQTIKIMESEMNSLRTKLQDKQDLLYVAERQRDSLEDKLRQRERQLEEYRDVGSSELGGNAIAASQMEIHMISQIDTLLKARLGEFASNVQGPAQLGQAADGFIPSAPASIAGNDFDNISVKAECVSIPSGTATKPDVDQLSAVSSVTQDPNVANATGSVGLGLLNVPAMESSTWKKPIAISEPSSSTSHLQSLDWLPLEPEDEERFEEEARWRDHEFFKRTAIGAANRKRLIKEEESRPAGIGTAVKEEPSLNPKDRLTQLAERNRRQPMHMRSAYPIEEATFLVSENELRTGKTLSIDGLAAVSSTPIHSEQSRTSQLHQQQFRPSKAPISRPTSLYAMTLDPKSSHVSANPAPSAIPKPVQMAFSPPTRPGEKTTTPKYQASSAVNANVPTATEDKENKKSKTANSALMIISPPVRNKKGAPMPVASKRLQSCKENKSSASSGTAFVISPPQKQSNNTQQQEKAVRSKPTNKSTSTPKKILGAVARAFGSSKNSGTEQTTSTEL